MSRPVISLGDAIRAAVELCPADKEARNAIIDILGLTGVLSTPAPPMIGAWKPTSPEQVSFSQDQRETPQSWSPPTQEVGDENKPGEEDIESVPSTLKLVHPGNYGNDNVTLQNLEHGDPLGSPEDSGTPLPPPPLFARIHRRGILSAALATYEEEGEIDLERVLATLSQGKPLTKLPRGRCPTLRKGTQLLLDISPAMDPFYEDQQNLIKNLDDILADDRLEILRFIGCPLRCAGKGPKSDWLKSWRPPSPGTPVVVVTDLSISGALEACELATTEEWLQFVAMVKANRSLLVGLIPFQPHRWPSRLARNMALLHWSERTTVGEVRRTMKEAYRRLA